jgi:hypothetical protein
MPRRSTPHLYTEADLVEAIQLTEKETSAWWIIKTKELIRDIVQKDVRDWKQMAESWLESTIRLRERNRRRSTRTVGQDKAIFEMRQAGVKWLTIAHLFGMQHPSSAMRAYARHAEQTST